MDVMEMSGISLNFRNGGSSLVLKRKRTNLKSGLIRSQMIQLSILLFPNMMKSMSYSSLPQVMKLIVTGFVKDWICST